MGSVHVGRKYTLTKPTSLMPMFDPPDPPAAVGQIKELAPGTTITVEATQQKWTTPWYRVRATSPEGKPAGAGWISGAELIGAKEIGGT